jgi:hypothetical protein
MELRCAVNKPGYASCSDFRSPCAFILGFVSYDGVGGHDCSVDSVLQHTVEAIKSVIRVGKERIALCMRMLISGTFQNTSFW